MPLTHIIEVNKIKKKKKPKIDFAKFDPDTGDKIATIQGMNTLNQPQPITPKYSISIRPFKRYTPIQKLRRQEAMADAMRSQEQPIDWLHALKSGTVGTSGGFVLSQLLNKKGRIAGLMSLGLGSIIAGLDLHRQLYKYNKQMAAREYLAGKLTPRALAYKKYLEEKYKNELWIKVFRNW